MSSSTVQPIKVWGKGGPNPPKIAMIVKELNIPHEIIPIEFSELKKPDFLAINPNGRMPAIQDPNTNLTLWESGAIIEYLIEKYDVERKISFEPGTSEYYHAKQWLFFQVSGQGPYYGQAVWFKKYHPEKVPGAVERYIKEIERVTGVLETHLKAQKTNGEDGPWLVGDKFSYADLAFVPWQVLSSVLLVEDGLDLSPFPTVQRWIDNLKKRPAIGEVVAEMFKH
ncbi:putative glutathione S-transferase 1 [Aaosphaeria arxii CBS 175.79]|uniref:Putative glutathione S-transferase 1 n=1 Tax=Aaosphaeria arxii CBS 175.79 TaxID=1450172 RepID=A0A6A5XMD3_9PLEO|nr:putative glutathione S-transferase 1 [Aaosphaeria arxii CBS 175.79]KAF2014066.1 putative glutathione S-transferase 1 [Aaosphaeria arxii CBS 175.79]